MARGTPMLMTGCAIPSTPRNKTATARRGDGSETAAATTPGVSTATSFPPDPRTYTWKVEYDGHCIGSAGLEVNPVQHSAEYTLGLFVAALRGRGLGREVTRLVLAWAFDVLGVHRVELQRWPAIAVPSTATWPAASVRKESAGKPNSIPTAGKTSS